MGIIGEHPEGGVRVDLERPRSGGPPWRYEGHAVTATARFPLAATVEADGTVSVDLDADAPAGLPEKARLLVRAAWKHAHEESTPPPRRIVRWRADV